MIGIGAVMIANDMEEASHRTERRGGFSLAEVLAALLVGSMVLIAVLGI